MYLSNRDYGTKYSLDRFSRGQKDSTFTASPAGPKDASGPRVSEVLPLIGKTFSSGGFEGGGDAVGWVLRNEVYVLAIERYYSPGGGLIYTYYTPADADWSRTVDAVLVRAARASTPRYSPSVAPSGSGNTTVSTNEAASSSGMGLMDKPWFWPAVIVVGVVGFMALRDNKR